MGANQSQKSGGGADLTEPKSASVLKRPSKANTGVIRHSSFSESNPSSSRNGQPFSSQTNGPNLIGLTSVEIRLVKRSWRTARRQGATEPGRTVMLAIFAKAPEIKHLFGHFSSSPRNSVAETDDEASEPPQTPERNNSDALHPSDKPSLLEPPVSPRGGVRRSSSMSTKPFDSTLFLSHAQRFTEVFDLVVSHLDSPTAVDGRLVELGKAHLRLVGDYVVAAKYWDLFGEIMVDKSLSWGASVGTQRNVTLTQAWIKVITFVVSKVKEGYESERLQSVRQRWGTVRRKDPSRRHATSTALAGAASTSAAGEVYLDIPSRRLSASSY